MNKAQLLYRFTLALLAENVTLLGFVKGYLREVGQLTHRDEVIWEITHDRFITALVRVQAIQREVPIAVPSLLRILAEFHRAGRVSGVAAYKSRPNRFMLPSEMFCWSAAQPQTEPAVRLALLKLQNVIKQTRYIAGGTAFRVGQLSARRKERG